MKNIFKQLNLKNSTFRTILYCLSAVITGLLLYFLIWLIFTTDGPFYVGDNIEKKDWLLFLSGFLSFVGTITITSIVIYQNKKYKEMDEERLRQYRALDIERFRLQNEPYLNFEKIDIYDEFEIITFNSFKDSLKNPDDRISWNKEPFSNTQRGINTTTFHKVVWINKQFEFYDKQIKHFITEELFNYTAIYKISNLGLGAAVDLKIKIEEKEFNFYKRNLPLDDSLYLLIDLKSLSDDGEKDKQFNINFKFNDISGNSYSLNTSFSFMISNPEYNNGRIVKGSFNFDIVTIEKSKLINPIS